MNPELKRKLLIGCVIGLVILAVIDFLDHGEHHHEFRDTYSWIIDTLYGVVGCAVIVYFSKWLGKVWLQRPEDYYDG